MLWLILLALCGPTSERISPPGTAYVRDMAADLSWVCGASERGLWLWIQGDGLFLLKTAVDLPANAEVLRCVRTPDGYRMLVWGRRGYVDEVFRLNLPLDLASLYSPGDFDHDGDVDQSDFGLLQRTLGTTEQRMTVTEFLKLRGAR